MDDYRNDMENAKMPIPFDQSGAQANDPIAFGQLAHMPTLQQRLDLAVKRAKEQLAAAEEAREILARNPDLERLLNLMQRSHF